MGRILVYKILKTILVLLVFCVIFLLMFRLGKSVFLINTDIPISDMRSYENKYTIESYPINGTMHVKIRDIIGISLTSGENSYFVCDIVLVLKDKNYIKNFNARQKEIIPIVNKIISNFNIGNLSNYRAQNLLRKKIVDSINDYYDLEIVEEIYIEKLLIQ